MEQKVIWPGWNVVRTIGRGGFGQVFEIQRDNFGDVERAALKVITIPENKSEIEELRQDGYDNASITERFRSYLESIVKEYSLMAQMKGHPNIVYCDDLRYIQHEDNMGWDIYIKMELLTPLSKAVSDEPTEEDVIRLGRDICNALLRCRQENIIHRDIKPQNIFVSRDGSYKLGDFGTARVMERTTSGTKVGTYKYMAPEVYRAQPYGESVDVYSLGLVMYWMLNRRRLPFLPLPPAIPTAAQEEEARTRRLSGETLPPPCRGSKALQDIIRKACAYDPGERYHSAAQLRDALAELEERTEGMFYSHTERWQRREEEEARRREQEQREQERQAREQKLREQERLRLEEEKRREQERLQREQREQQEQERLRKLREQEKNRKFNRILKTVSAVVVLVTVLLAGYSLVHLWEPATCTEPQTCILCGKAGEKASGHMWEEIGGTYRICLRCGMTVDLPREEEQQETEALPPEEQEQLTKDAILEKAWESVADGEHRKAIQAMDDAWRQYGDSAFYSAAADLRHVFAMDSKMYMAAGKFNTFWIRMDRTIGAVGDNSYGEMGAKSWTDIIGVSAGDRHVVGLQGNGTMVAAGANDEGQCNVTSWRDVVEFSAGDTHTVALLADGTVVATGYNAHGQCDAETLMMYAGDKRIVSVAAGYIHTVALLEDGTVIAVGSNETGACNVWGWTDIAAIYAGTEFTAGLKTDGTVVVTGLETDQWNLYGWTDLVSLSAGDYYLVGLKADGSVVAEGLQGITRKDKGQLGVSGWKGIYKVAAGNDHTVALDFSGNLWCVGSNEKYQCDCNGIWYLE